MAILHIFAVRESLVPLWRAQTFVLARVSAFNCDSADLRWAVVALASSVLAFTHRQFSRWARGVLRRAWQGARFAAGRRAADSMVAAGGN